MKKYDTIEKNHNTAIHAGLSALFIGAAGLIGFGCAKVAEEPKDKVRMFVNDAGYLSPEVTDVDIFGVQLRGCGEQDLVGYDVSAISPTTGNEIELKVCDGFFKGMTIRSNG